VGLDQVGVDQVDLDQVGPHHKNDLYCILLFIYLITNFNKIKLRKKLKIFNLCIKPPREVELGDGGQQVGDEVVVRQVARVLGQATEVHVGEVVAQVRAREDG
jgi:hypothetical protein